MNNRKSIYSTARTSQAGFTLMELIVAVGLMAVMFTSLSVVFQQVTELIRRSESEIEIYQTFRLVSKILKKDFESMVNYEEPVFYMRYNAQGQYDPKEDLCGYLRMENHVLQTGVPGNFVNRAVDNICFLGTDSTMIDMENYIVPPASRYRNTEAYVKSNMKGTDLVEISYGVEDKSGKVVGVDNPVDKDMMHKWKLIRYTRKVIPREKVSDEEEARGLYGLIFKGDIPFNALNGRGTDALGIGMGVFSGIGTDKRIWIQDYEGITKRQPTGRRLGLGETVEKYGKREIIAEGCTEFDVKYWYFRKRAPHSDWRNVPYDRNSPDPGAPNRGGNPDNTKDPYLLLGHFYNGCPPNPACMRTPGNPHDDETQFSFMGDYAAGDPADYASSPSHPNWWYLPRMVQVRLKLRDRYQIIEQDFTTRIFIPCCSPYPATTFGR